MESNRFAAAQVLAAPSRVDLLHHLQRLGPTPISELATATNLHQNTVREHLARLIELDFVRREPEVRTTRGRPRMLYRATSAADALEDPRATERLERSIAQAAFTRALVEGFVGAAADAKGRAETAGASVGRSLPTAEVAPGPTATVTTAPGPAAPDADRELYALEAHLSSFGFDPELEADSLTFHLWRCPFLELAKERPQVVCSVHTGLAQGVLETAGGHLEVAELRPFVGPEHCTLTLRGRGQTADASATAGSEATAAS